MPGKGLEITGENLEDLLAYDDLFLDYFNCHLALPVFPQALLYNRLTGAFEEVEDTRTDVSSSLPSIGRTHHYGPTDAERDKMLEWAREERLPLFLRTQLFRELKLIKLLLRPLELDRQSASRGSSRNIRGHSRATESYVSSLSINGDDNSEDVYVDDGMWGELNYSALFKHQRPGSRALSLPAGLALDNQSFALPSSINSASTRSTGGSTVDPMSEISSRTFKLKSAVKISEYPENPEDKEETPDKIKSSERRSSSSQKFSEMTRQRTRISNKVEVIPSGNSDEKRALKTKSSQRTERAPASSTEEVFVRGARVISAPVSYEDFIKRPVFASHDLEALFGAIDPEFVGQPYVQFEEEAVSDEQTETDMRNLEGRLKMTVQEAKERMLGSRAGFDDFRVFMKGTAGEDLLSFWLDCENYKDTMEHFDDIENMEIRNAHFKDIQAKYRLKLTQDAKDQISKAASNVGLSHTIFIRTQYDVLRRLRAYWVPRFLLHCERTRRMSIDDADKEVVPTALPIGPSKPLVLDSSSLQPSFKNQMSFFPSITLAHSMPVLPEDARDYAKMVLFSNQTDLVNTENQSLFPRQRSILSAKPINGLFSNYRSTKERFILALAADQLAGGPFQRYLAKRDKRQLLASLLFWEDVTEYGANEEHVSDRLLRLCHAWNIYNKYLADDSPYKIDFPERELVKLQNNLMKAREFIEASIFDNAKVIAVECLEKAWVRFLKEDLKTFLDCRAKALGESPPSTADAIDITLTDFDLIIHRPRPWLKRTSTTSTERAHRHDKKLEPMDEATRARRKAEALARRKEMEKERRKAVKAAYARQKEAKLKKGTVSDADDELLEGVAGREGTPTFSSMINNKQMMTMFRKYVGDKDGKDTLHQVMLCADIDHYFAAKENKNKKDAYATAIMKNYLDPSGKKHTPLAETVKVNITSKERPKTPLLKDIQKSLLSKIEELFKEFILKQAEEFQIDPKDLANMSQTELALRMGNEPEFIAGWNRRKTKGKTSGKAPATKEDKKEFLSALGHSALGHPSIQMLYFYKHLLKHGSEDGIPQIDKDLFFYIEVQKFKEGSHSFSDDLLLKGKVQSIVDCFLDSVVAPSLQVNIPADMHQRTLKASQRYLNGKEVSSIIFDEAQVHVFKELLFYWAGFKRATTPSKNQEKKPVTKYEKMLRKRLENIQNYQMPSSTFTLPAIPEGAVPSFSITLSEGVKFKEMENSSSGSPILGDQKENRSKVAIFGPDGAIRRSRTSSRQSSIISRS